MIKGWNLSSILANELAIPVLIVYILVIFVPVYMFVCADPSDSGFNGVVSRFLLVDVPNVFRRGLRACCGQRVVDGLEHGYDYVFNQRNPIMQIMYILLINGAYITWMVTGLPKLPTHLVGYEQSYVALAFVAFAQFTYYLACTVGPGTITRDNVLCFSHQPYDGLLYLPESQCSSCQIPKVCLIYTFRSHPYLSDSSHC